MKHTSGPWIIDKDRSVMTEDFKVIAEVYSWMGPQEADANAALIAAAPELLEALKQIMCELPIKRDWLNPDIERLAKHALAKVEAK
jgi:hypothetical protein